MLEDSHLVKGKKRLQVLPVCVTNLTTGKGRNILALLDSGADTHLLTKEVFVDLDLNGKPIESNLQLADDAVKKLSSFETTCSVRGVNEESSFILDKIRIVETMPDLSQSIPSPIDVERKRHLQDIMIPIIDAEQIDLIIGMDAPGLHVFSEVRKGGDSSLWAGRSPLGWVFFGRDYGHVNTSTAVVLDSHVNLLVSPDLGKEMKAVCPCQCDLFDSSCKPDVLLPSLDDKRAQDLMEESCALENGHHRMRLPWKEGCPNLPDNHSVALSRLTSLGVRLTKDPVIHAKYKNKINEMLALRHALEVTTEEHVEGKTWYIPHHCTSGKFRVVFDCAATYKGTSLNA